MSETGIIKRSVVFHILIFLSISGVLSADDLPTRSIRPLTNSKIPTGEIKQIQPEIPKGTLQIKKTSDVATGSVEPSHNSGNATGEIKSGNSATPLIEPSDDSRIKTGDTDPPGKEDIPYEYARQPKNRKQLFKCSDQ